MTTQNFRYLYALIMAVLLIALTISYFSLEDWSLATLKKLTVNTLPGAILLALAWLTYYVFIQRKGLDIEDQKQVVIESNDVDYDRIHNIVHGDIDNSAITYFPSFKMINWDEIFPEATRLDIIVCYYDSWAHSNQQNLKNFFDKGGELNLFLGNPEDPKVFETIMDRFPENRSNPDELKDKITGTMKKICDYADESDSTVRKFKAYYLDQSPNYSLVLINKNKAILSTYEQFRIKNKKILSPAFLIDFSKTPESQFMWLKEIDEYVKNSALQIER